MAYSNWFLAAFSATKPCFAIRAARWPILCSLGLGLGCQESVESTDIRTTGIYPEITVTATGSGTSKVEVTLKVGGSGSNTVLDLTGEDQLKATVAGTTKILDDNGSQTYGASFPVDAEGTEFVISLLRGDVDDSAPASTVSLPAPFELTLAPTDASRATDAIELSWTPVATGNVRWAIAGGCIQSTAENTPDDGAQSIAAGTIETFESDKDKSCTVDLEMTRNKLGQVDPAFTEGGSVIARHVRTASFTSNP